MTDEPLSNVEAELLGVLIQGERALAALHGPPDLLEPGLLALGIAAERGFADEREARHLRGF